MICPACGYENKEGDKFCADCGTSLEIPTIEKSIGEPSKVIIVLGYVMGILGVFSLGILSIIGLIIGASLYRKGHPQGRTHGLIIMIISVAVLLIVGLAVIALLIYWQYFYNPL